MCKCGHEEREHFRGRWGNTSDPPNLTRVGTYCEGCIGAGSTNLIHEFDRA